MKQVNNMLEFIYDSPTSFQAIDNIKKDLLKEGYIEYNESNNTMFEKGKKYFVTRNQTSIIAFNIGDNLDKPSFNVVASHSDCPSYKLKPNTIIKDKNYIKLNTEGYGGMIKNTWLDKPLSFAGRVIVKSANGVESRLLNVKEKIMVIPNVAIHLNRDIGSKPLNQQVDLLPIISGNQEFDLKKFIGDKLDVDYKNIINYDLYLYPVEEGFIFDEFFSSFHIDNLECAYTSLQAFKNTFNKDNINVYVCFDNEEVGSRTRQGAASHFLKDILDKIAKDLGFDINNALASSLMVSADNGHAVHPNHPELTDATNYLVMNKGIGIKYNANQSYTSDALSVALFTDILNKANVPSQIFTNRSDLVGGGTLGSISSSMVSILSIDIGLGQLAMHSTMETAGVKDAQYMIDGLKAFYNTHIIKEDEANYKLEN